MYRNMNNVRVFAKNNGSKTGFTIFLDFSGIEEPLVAHKHNGFLYNYLKDGVRIEELERFVHRNKRSPINQKLNASLRQVLKVANDFILFEFEPVRQRAFDSNQEQERCA